MSTHGLDLKRYPRPALSLDPAKAPNCPCQIDLRDLIDVNLHLLIIITIITIVL